jgi:serine/threonine-protein kinase
MLTKDQFVKVMDFGIAKMASSSKTQTDMVLGTPTYMSPEQIAGKVVDGRTDIFSLGVVMFELLTGRPPFTADNVSALLFAIAHNPLPCTGDAPLRSATYRSASSGSGAPEGPRSTLPTSRRIRP